MKKRLKKPLIKIQKVFINRVRIVEDLNNRLKYKNWQAEQKINILEEEKNELQKEIERLKLINEKMQNRLNNDSTNSGIPTSQTPIDKKKLIPNSRNRTGNKIGGQTGHSKNKLEHFEEEELTEIVEETIEECPYCTCDELEETGILTEENQEIDWKYHYQR